MGCGLWGIFLLQAQSFYFGADLSYVNEMEDCGVQYKDENVSGDPYQIFADHQCNLVRLRLWHTPSWYDNLNDGNRYSDFQDVRRSIIRAKAAGMQVLLDFHLSDNWADPSHQLAPAAWQGIVNNLPVLKDSLYNYISKTLQALAAEDLLPEMVQIGNETNKGILLSQAADAGGWTLDWSRNAQLFNRAIQAVRDVSAAAGKPIKVALHVAGPNDVTWLMQGFWSNGVTDFDIIGISYYWAWHHVQIPDAGNIVAQLRQTYPGKDVMIFETGYIWTTQNNDNANNIISEVHPDYAPASPDHQRQWLIDMTQEMINRGASGVIYWEPAWVSSPCWTQWGQGSHQEHATFFDFNSNVLPTGGMFWMSHTYDNLVPTKEPARTLNVEVYQDSSHRRLIIHLDGLSNETTLKAVLFGNDGKQMAAREFQSKAGEDIGFDLPSLSPGIYYLSIYQSVALLGVKRVWIKQL